MQVSSVSSVVGRTCGLISFALVVGTLFWLREIFIPLALAILLTFLLAPVATRLQRWGFSRALSVICSVLFAVLTVGAIGYTFTSQLLLIRLFQQATRYWGRPSAGSFGMSFAPRISS
jgi:predicted PurR-regulated permease PerM